MVTIERDGITATGDDYNAAKKQFTKLQREKKREAQKSATYQRQARQLAMITGYNFLFRKLKDRDMPRAWIFKPLGTGSAFQPIENTDAHDSDHCYRATTFRDESYHSCIVSVYHRDKIIGSIENSAGVIGLVVEHWGDVPRVYGFGLSGASWAIEECPGITADDFPTA